MVRSEERAQFLQDVIDVATEGGITYWAYGLGIETATGFKIVDFEDLRDNDDDPFEGEMFWNHNLAQKAYAEAYSDGLIPETYVFEINPDVIAKGIHTILKLKLVNDEMTSNIYLANRNNDAGEIDAYDADAIVQSGLWGEVKYG